MTEKELQTKLTSFLKNHNYKYYKTWGGLTKGFNGQSYTQTSGWPDILIIGDMNPCVIMIELKTDTGTFTASQVVEFKEMISDGMTIYCLRPKNWENFKSCFRTTKNIHDTCEMSLPKISIEELDKRYSQLYKRYGKSLKAKKREKSFVV